MENILCGDKKKLKIKKSFKSVCHIANYVKYNWTWEGDNDDSWLLHGRSAGKGNRFVLHGFILHNAINIFWSAFPQVKSLSFEQALCKNPW